MDNTRFLECLDDDVARLRHVAEKDLTAAVPTCPEWTVEELVRHVAMVFLHKVESLRNDAPPKPWPPDLSAEPALPLLDRSYAAVRAALTTRDPDSATWTWFAPDRTVRFWFRRMALEAVIHRVDAELALGEARADIPDDLALDGIDEVLLRFLAFGSVEWRDEFVEPLAGTEGRGVRVTTAGREWLVTATPEAVTVTRGEASGAAATVSGDPTSLLLWLWRREGDEAVTVEGDAALVGKVRELLEIATQ